MRRKKKTVIKGVSMVSDEEGWNRNKRTYNLMDIQCKAEVAKGAQWMDADAEAKVAKSAQWTNADELKYPSDFYAVMRLMKRHGDVKLSKILATFSPIGFICPQCNGTGTVREKYATDMLAVSTGCADWSYRDAECPLCQGTGAVSKKLKLKMVQDGWEEA